MSGNCCIDFSTKEELGRSNPHYFTKFYSVELSADWHPNQTEIQSSNDALKSAFKKGQRVAIKVFSSGPEEEKTAAAKKRCRNEYVKLSNLRLALVENNLTDKNWFVMVIGEGEDKSMNGGPLVILELGECSLGYLLHQRKADCPSLAEEDSGSSVALEEEVSSYTADHCFTYIANLYEAISFLHKQGLMHRDLKSYNVLLFNNKTVCKLCDFEDCKDINTLKMTAKMGTSWWRAPELYQNVTLDGETQYGETADLYSFGLLMCEALFREEPFICYYTGKMSERAPEPSRVFADPKNLLPRKDEIDHEDCAMYIEIETGMSPKVIVSKEKCVFTSIRDRPKVWNLINKLLHWNPEDRLQGSDLSRDIHEAITGHGRPKDILLKPTNERTDTGIMPNEQVISWKPAPICIEKIYLKIVERQNQTLEDDDKHEIESRLNEHTAVIFTIDKLLEIPVNSRPTILFNFKSDGKLALTIYKGEAYYINEVKEVCNRSEKLASKLSELFQVHKNGKLKNLQFSST